MTRPLGRCRACAHIRAIRALDLCDPCYGRDLAARHGRTCLDCGGSVYGPKAKRCLLCERQRRLTAHPQRRAAALQAIETIAADPVQGGPWRLCYACDRPYHPGARRSVFCWACGWALDSVTRQVAALFAHEAAA